MKKIFTFAIISLALIAWNGGVGAYAAPVISFVEPPTPADGATIYDTSVQIEVSITEAALVDVTFNWDGMDYWLYDNFLVLMFNFDNVALLGEDYVDHPEYGVEDLSGKENHGILSATPGIPQWVTGKYGGAFDFTGDGGTSGQSILVPHSESLNPDSGDFAIAVWILTRDDVDGDIIRKGSSGTTEPDAWYKLEHSPSLNNNKIGLHFNTDGTDALFASAAAYNDYQWHFVVAQRKGNLAELWIDGELDGSAPVTGSISNTADLAVGSKDTQNDDFLNSTLDEVRIYMRSFLQDEIKELYYSNLSKYAADGWTLYVNQSNLSDETAYTYQASASDTAETSSTEVRSLTVDLIGPPDVTLEAPSEGSILNNTSVTFTCSAADSLGLLDASLYVGSSPETVTFSGPADTDDAQISADSPNTNYGSATSINVDGLTPHAHAVIKFLNVFGEEAGQVPLGSTIVSATLGVNCTNQGNMMKLYRLTEDWVESEVTWNESSTGVQWENSGADGPESNAGFALDGDCTATGWRTMDITQFVQEWSDGTGGNFGIVMTDSGGTDGIDFDSSESANPPVLTVTFGQSGLQLIETVPMSGISDTVSFSTVNLQDQQNYTWNCLIRNTSLMESWAPADFHLSVDTAYPDEPILIQPADDATVVGLSQTLEVMVSDPQGAQGGALDVTFYGHSAGSTDEFTIVVLPDTQKYVENGNYPEIFTTQTQWIIDNKETLNIVFVTHEGDIVQNWNNTTEWDYANASMSLLDGVVPYSVVPGDHDHYGEDPPGSTEYYELYFPASRLTGYSWWGGSYAGNFGGDYNEDYPHTNNNNYQLLTIGGQDYIFLSLDFCPSQDEIDWANGVLTTYSDRKAILTTHALLDTNADYKGSGDFWLYPDGTSNSTGDTSLIWSDLIQNHEKLQLVLCGHMHGEARRTDDNLAGQSVHQLLANYQGRPNGGNGWLRIMRFVPAENKVYVQTYSPWLDQYETDADSQFTLDLPLYYFEEIGTVTGVTSGSNASVVWTGLSDGTEYEWFVEVTDTSQNTQVGPTWSFTAIDNPQQARNPSPVNGATNVNIDSDLSWTKGLDAVSHNVYFGTDIEPHNLTPVKTGVENYEPGTLNPATTYYWAVDELDGSDGLLAAGATWSFTTAPAPGQASAPFPIDTATDVDIDAVLSWTAGSDTTSHDVYFGTGNPPAFVQTQSGNTFDPVIDYATTYYWRIDEAGPGGTTTGQVWSFTTMPAPPPGPATNPIPADGAEGVLVDADLSWSPGSDAYSYDVYFGTSYAAVEQAYPLPMCPEYKGHLEEVTTFDPDTLEKGITYYWRIDTYNIYDDKTVGAVWSFTTILPPPPEQATSPYPTDGMKDAGVMISLQWVPGAGATSHDVYFGSDPCLVTDATKDSDEFKENRTDTSYHPGEMDYSSTYYWRIDEVGLGGTTKGDTWSYTTQDDTFPPHFAYPPDAVSITAQEATITWTTNEPSDSLVEYSLDTSYGESVYDGTMVTEHSVTLTGLKPGTAYYYRATSTDQAGNSTTEYPYPDLFFTTETLPPELPWSDDFESGDFAAGGWTVLVGPASVDGGAAYTGSFGAHLKKTGTIEKSISTAGYQSIHVKYARKTGNLKSNEFLYVDWYDGSGWHSLETTQDTSWSVVDNLCGVGADNNPNFKVRFRMNGKAGNVEAMVDDVEITGTPSGPDTTPPSPDPTWAVYPHATTSTSISMTVTTASDVSGVEYYFACITDETHDSDWQDSPTYEDTLLTTGTEYTYQVLARDKSPSQNETGWSDPASATPTDVPPAPPTGLAATPGDSQVSLDWDDNTEPDLVGYNVYRRTEGEQYTHIATLLAASDYLDLAVTNGVTYYYVVTAVDSATPIPNESDISNEVSATPDSFQTVSVSSIEMALFAGKKSYATATITVSPALSGATVVGDWYFKGSLRVSGATAVTNPSGIAVLTSMTTPAKSGDTFMFMVTDVVLSGYVYDPGQGVTSGSISVP